MGGGREDVQAVDVVFGGGVDGEGDGPDYGDADEREWGSSP